MLTSQQFNVLACCVKTTMSSQRAIAESTGLSLGSVNTAVNQLKDQGLLDESNNVTEAGYEALEPYKVDNAIIMAAGTSSRFAPISYEKPKGVLNVRGEILIERQIRQLHEAGITDIILVVGYKKECFFYLEEKFGVKIVVNSEFATRNNNSSIKVAEKYLGNSYICSSDDYFTVNPFERYVYASYYAAMFEEGKTKEYCIYTKGKEQLITRVTVGGEDAWVMLGHAYWSRSYSARFTQFLNEIYDNPSTAGRYWEDIYIDHIDELPMVMRGYEPGVIWEFDSLDELREFDPEFINNVDCDIMDNICQVLECTRDDIRNIIPIKQGLTNLSFRFTVADHEYVYRHPGYGTDAIINRASETASQKVAAELGIDSTFIFEDPEKGWKISHYLSNRAVLDYHDWDQVAKAMDMARKMHTSGADTGFPYDMYEGLQSNLKLLSAKHKTAFADFNELLELSGKLNALAKAHNPRICLCHNDFYEPNFLVDGDDIQLIDWEYSGMSDYASDLGVFICCCPDYTYEDALRILEMYFQGTPDPEDLFHCIAYFSVVGFYWFIWALYQDMCGSPVGEFLYLWYRYCKMFGAKALELAEELGY